VFRRNSIGLDRFFQKVAIFCGLFEKSAPWGLNYGKNDVLMTAKSQLLTPTRTAELLPTRRSLLDRLKDWTDNTSWQVFFDTYWRLIYKVALKAGLNESEAEEVVQQTMISVAKAMKDFRYDPARGSFKGWLLQLTGWRIRNQFQRRQRGNPLAFDPLPEGADPGSPATAVISGARGSLPGVQVPPDLERLWDAEWEDNLMATALERVRKRANPKHFQIFDLCILKQKPVQEVREFLDVSTMEVYLSRHRIARLVAHEIKRLREQLAHAPL